jgi:hypothetical protein
VKKDFRLVIVVTMEGKRPNIKDAKLAVDHALRVAVTEFDESMTGAKSELVEALPSCELKIDRAAIIRDWKENGI